MRHLDSDNIVVQWIEITPASQNPVRNLKLVDWLVRSEYRLAHDKK